MGRLSREVGRLPYSVSMVAGSVEPAVDYLQKYAGDAKDFVKFGLRDLLDLFADPRGESFVVACRFLNADNEHEMKVDDCKKHVKSFVTFLSGNSTEKADTFRRVASSSARLYLASMALLEMTALIDRPQTWAKAMDRSGASTDLKNWLKDADDMTKLQTAMVSALVARGQDKAGQKRKASALSSSFPSHGPGGVQLNRAQRIKSAGKEMLIQGATIERKGDWKWYSEILG